MPKVVDHSARRRELGEAAYELVLESGLPGTTVRALCARTGRSSGSVRHYLPSQADLRLLLAEVVAERISGRVNELIRELRDGDRVEMAARCVEQLLPLDRRRREEFRVWWALVGAAEDAGSADGDLFWDGQRVFYRQLIAMVAGRTDYTEALGPFGDTALDEWTDYLHAFIDGITEQAMLAPRRVDAATAGRTVRGFLAVVRDGLR